VGGATAAARNVISGNAHYGISIREAGTINNVVAGNYIGTNALGTGALGNAFAGAALLAGAQSNIIGGAATAARNVLSGNGAEGVVFAEPGTNGNSVLGNFIGTNAAGTAAIANGFAGVAILNGAQSSVVGGNLISGNTNQGVAIADSNTALTIVQGNTIGLNLGQTAALANGSAGISIYLGANSNTVGGVTAAARNIISGNTQAGITISDPGTTLNLVQGNYIGVDLAGAAPIANGFSGIDVYLGAQNNTIGGTAAGARNVISGNSGRGIGFFNTTTSNNFVRGNFIGLNAAGTGAVGNGFSGVEFFLASNNTLGGTSPGARNFISGNLQSGVLIDGSNTTGNLVQGNTIGLTPTGAAAPNLAQAARVAPGRAPRDDLQGTDLGQPREDFVLDAIDEVGVLLVRA